MWVFGVLLWVLAPDAGQAAWPPNEAMGPVDYADPKNWHSDPGWGGQWQSWSFAPSSYKNLDARQPMKRYAMSHLYNNYIEGDRGSGNGPDIRIGSDVYVEKNHYASLSKAVFGGDEANSGATITGQLNTFHYTVIDQIPGVNKAMAMETFPAMIVAVQSGAVDGYVAEEDGAQADTAANPDLTYIKFDEGKGFERLALLEEAKALPWNAVYDEFCLRNNVPVGQAFIADVEQYEKDVTSKRG